MGSGRTGSGRPFVVTVACVMGIGAAIGGCTGDLIMNRGQDAGRTGGAWIPPAMADGGTAPGSDAGTSPGMAGRRDAGGSGSGRPDGGGAVGSGSDAGGTIRRDAGGVVPTGRFVTLPVGAALPSDSECAARVRPAAEVRRQNATANSVRGTVPNADLPRVTGNFTGTTDELLQWVACKWGIDEDVVRAQIAKESYWDQAAVGDGGESFGLGQVRVPYHASAFVDDNARRSSAYNLDYTYGRWRECFEGAVGWLNDFDPPMPYGAGDMWGCLGVWFSGRWYPSSAVDYIAAVQDYLDQRIWETEPFLNYGR